MPHQFLAHVLNHACFNEARVEGRAQILKAEGSNAGPSNCGLPGSLDPVNGFSFMGKDKSFGQRLCRKQLEESLRHWNFAAFAAGSLRLRNDDHSPNQIYIRAVLIEDFAPA